MSALHIKEKPKLKTLKRHRHCIKTRKSMKCELTSNVPQVGVDNSPLHNIKISTTGKTNSWYVSDN
ncbi:hypothetical protein TSUD_336270 [Trifolium subterraneum]|uniref:Uncharacterized protein n=1 Tax=Trifolium subterraneum TaxID=3900 RepID=A0A2Z6M380_TRISU|nr:hypothetical protein TSUD_336270 [Trifolium subterraneum]